MKKVRLLVALLISFCMFSATDISANAEGIVEGGYFTCVEGSDTARWKLTDSGDLILYGTGTIKDLSFSMSSETRKQVKRVYCEDILKFSDYDISNLFSGMENVEIINLSTLESVDDVCRADSMFYGCKNLQEINLPKITFNTVNTTQGRHFVGCNSMFDGCENLKKLTVTNSSSGDISELPLKEGYIWYKEGTDSSSWSSPLKIGGKYSNIYVQCFNYSSISDITTLVLEPQQYKLTYECRIYSKDGSSKYYDWDEEAKEMKYVGSNGTYSKNCVYSNDEYGWNCEENPLTYNIELGDIKIKEPSNIPNGYTLLSISPEIFSYSRFSDNILKDPGTIYATIVPTELISTEDGNSTESTENSSTESTEVITSEDNTNTSENTTQFATTETSTKVEKSTEVETSKSDIKPESTASTDSKAEVNKSKSMKAVIKSTKNSKGKKIKLSLKKEKGYKYQIKVSTSRKFNKNVKSYNTPKTSYTVSKVKKGKTYYIKARTYKKVNGKTVYGKWSSVKKVKIKK